MFLNFNTSNFVAVYTRFIRDYLFYKHKKWVKYFLTTLRTNNEVNYTTFSRRNN